MHLNQINSFLAVSKTLNFTSAARQLGVPQSTISRQINDLESQLGVRLFYRTKRDVQLTDEGRIFLPFAQEMADAVRKGSYAVRQIHEGAAGRLSIASIPACSRFLSEALAAFHAQYPDITVDLTPLTAGESLMDETDTPYDFWFLYRDMLLDPENFEYLHTHREPLCIVRRETPEDTSAPTKNPAGSPPDLEDLSSERFIMLSEETDPILYMQTMNYCRTHRFTPKVVNTFPEVSSVLLSARAGLGIAVLPESLSQEASASDRHLEIIPLPDESYVMECIAAWKPSLLNPAAALFLELLQRLV